MARRFANARTIAISFLAGLALTACTAAQPSAAPTAAPQAAVTAAPAPTLAPALVPTAAAAEPAAPVATEAAAPTAAPISAEPVADPGDPAAVALEQFLTAMHEGRYEEAAALYAGDYMMLQMYNPTLAPDDHAALLESACEVNGFKCLAPHSITPSAQLAGAYDVTFRNDDGSVFGIQAAGSNNIHSSFGLLTEETPEGPRPITMPPFVS